MINVTGLGHVTLRTADVERLVAHYTGVLDFVLVERGPDGTAYLSTEAGHHSLAVSPQDEAGLGDVAFVLTDEDLGDVVARLQDAGIGCERRTDPEPGIAEDVVLGDPDGTALRLQVGRAGGGDRRPAGVRPGKLGHVCYHATDIRRTVAFFEQTLGFRVSDWVEDFFVFLRCSPEHHTVNLLEVPAKAASLHHVAWELRDWAHVEQICNRLAAGGAPLVWGPGRHGPGHNIFTYHRDPDGNVVELFCELDVMLDEAWGAFDPRPWHADYPQRPKVWEAGPLLPNAWGPLPPEGFLR